MSEAAWLTVAVTIIGIFGTAITAILKREPKEESGGNRNAALCPAHSGLVSDISALREGNDRIERGMRDIWNAVDEIRSDVRGMAQYKSNGGTQ